MKRLSTFALVAIALLFTTSSLLAAPIQQGGGVWGNAIIPGNSGADISFISGFFTNAQPPQPATDGLGTVTPAGAYTVSNLNIGLSTFDTNPGSVQIFDSLTVTGTVGGDAGKTAVLDFAGSTGTLVSIPAGATVLTATVQLQSSNITGIDFGPNGGLFLFTLTTQGLDFQPGNPGTVSGTPQSGSFTLVALDVPIIPEPISLVIWANMGVAAVWYLRRRARACPTVG